MISSKALKALSTAMSLALLTFPATAEPISETFSVSNPDNTQTVNYSAIGDFIGALCVEQSSRTACAYSAIDQQGRPYLERFKSYLGSIPVSGLNKDEQLAFWLNTHNLLVLDAIASGRNTSSVKSARGTHDAPGTLWTEKRIKIEGVELSIDDIERHILLANFESPNVIYGIYQGTRSGPALPADGFSGSTVNATLADLGEAYINSRDGVKVRRNDVEISEIYDWYLPVLFDGDEAAMREHLLEHATGKRAEALSTSSGFKTAKFSYRTDNYQIRQQLPPARLGGGTVSGGGS